MPGRQICDHADGLLTTKEITAKTFLSVAVVERGGPRKLPDYEVTMNERDYNIRLRMIAKYGGGKPSPTGIR